jgi:5-methyltetrahydrofolate--homocysteine methyltransferase
MTLRQSSGQARAERAELLREIGSERILVKDGPYGSMIQSYRLDEEGFRAGRSFNHDQKGNNDLLNLTRPDVVGEICKAYIDAGADILATNTFNSNAISLSDYGIAGMTREINLAAAKLTRACADEATAKNPDKPRFVVGALGPTNKTLSVSPNVNDPGYRAVSFDEMKGIYREQIDGLLDGGVDFILIETVFDTLNAKAALVAADEAAEARGEELPVMVSMTLTDLAGRNLSGQTVEAFWHSVRHAKPLTMGLNCSFGATELHPYVNALNPQVEGMLCVYPNAGLPNELGAYDEPPEMTAKLVKGWAENGWLNVVGGCCGTTPAHIKAIAEAVKDVKPRQWHALPPALRLSGMEAASFF